MRELAVIRFALLAGVLMFGAVTWYIRNRSGAPPTARPGEGESFRYIVPVLCVLALGVAAVVRRQIAGTRDVASSAGLRVVAWAVGEGSALAGCVHYFLTGDPRLYVLGVVALLATFIIVPLRET